MNLFLIKKGVIDDTFRGEIMSMYYDYEENSYRKYPDGDIVTLKELSELYSDKVKENTKLKMHINELDRENQRLKENYHITRKAYQNIVLENVNYEVQQKKFIQYLESEIENNRKEATCMVAYNYSVLPLKVILSKYKEIVGK